MASRTNHARRIALRTPITTVLVLAAGMAFAQTTSNAANYAISSSAVVTGGGIGTKDCYTLVATIGEAAGGSVTNGKFTLTSGFLVAVGPTGDVLFRNGLETNTGECTP